MHDALKHAARCLDQAHWGKDEVTGIVQGVMVTASVRDDPNPQSSSDKVFVAEAKVDPKGLRVEGFFGDAKSRLYTGDATFDGAYVLRGAPGDVAVTLFDASSRESILRVRARVACDTSGLRVMKAADTVTNATMVKALIDLAAHLGARVPGSFVDANRAYLDRVPGDENHALAGLDARRRLEMQSFYSLEETGARVSPSSVVVVVVVACLVLALAIGAVAFLLLR